MYFFVSDVHLRGGWDNEAKSCERRFVKWLDSIAPTAKEIYLLGDIFDFWYEYNRVVPKGFVRVLAKLAELTERGIKVIFIAGNHDMWVKEYFCRECGVEIYTSPQIFEIAGRRVYLAHGDNLNIAKSWGLRLLNGVFRSRVVRWLFSWLVHPDLAISFGQWWSRSSRKKHDEYHDTMRDGSVVLIDYATSHHTELGCDYYFFGHMHKVAEGQVDNARIMLINDWSKTPHYIEMSAEGEASIKGVEESI